MLAIALAHRNNTYTIVQSNYINIKKRVEAIRKENKFSLAIYKSRQKK